IAIPSPSEMRWLRRREAGTCCAKRRRRAPTSRDRGGERLELACRAPPDARMAGRLELRRRAGLEPGEPGPVGPRRREHLDERRAVGPRVHLVRDVRADAPGRAAL